MCSVWSKLLKSINNIYIYIPYLSELALGRLFNYWLFEGALFEGGANSSDALIKKKR